VNLLFVNYGDFTTNSLNHIAGFASALTARGHACAVAVSHGKDTLRVIPNPNFRAVTYEEALADPAGLFPDRRPADLLHAWTPREVVRKFVIAYERLAPTRLIVHLEDNEEFLIESYLGRPLAELRSMLDGEFPADIPDRLPHPLRYRNLLRLADGITIIVDELRRFVPPQIPAETIPPGVDFAFYQPQPADPAFRAELGLSIDEKVLVFTGGNTHANEPELRELYHAVHLLNQRGLRTRLVRTGIYSPEFLKTLDFDASTFILDLGFVEKTRLPKLLALADVLVQPGHPGPFNDYRLPSKIPEFLAMGKPVVLPAANVGLALRDGEDALLLRSGSAGEIADACARLFTDPVLAAKLGQNALSFAHGHFNLADNTTRLADFYTATLNRDVSSLWLVAKKKAYITDVSLLAEQLRRQFEGLGQTLPLSTSLTEAATDLVLLCHQLEAEARPHLADELNKMRSLGRTIISDARREIIRLRDLVYQREKKILSLQASFSWRITAPLRALRRLLLDPYYLKQDKPPDPANFPPVYFHHTPHAFNPSLVNLRHDIDSPSSWDIAANRIDVIGWCFAFDEIVLTAVRAHIDNRILPGVYGLSRPDVAAQNAPFPQAKQCGFKIELDLKSDDREIIIEIGDALGRWHCIFSRTFGGSSSFDCLGDYTRWVHAYDTLSPEQLSAMAGSVGHLRCRPLISVLMPVYNTPEKWLVRAIESVRSQIYEQWELCIADDASTKPHIRPLLEKAAREDPRIKVVFRETNGHISAASNSALALAQGDFVALLDHDDELRPHALACIAFELDRFPDADLIYSDEDKLNDDGFRYGPYFKPDWNHDLFLAQNFICHLGAYRTTLLRELGGFRLGYEGSQDWDLAMQVIERIPPSHIRHIPRILYHWRAVQGSTAKHVSEKNYSMTAARKVVADHFERVGIKVTLTPTKENYWRVHYPLPNPAPSVTLIVPTRNRVNLLRPCIVSILKKTTYPNYKILVIDNNSDKLETLAYLDKLRQHPRCRVLTFPGPFNFSALNNFAVHQTDTPLVGLLNNDLEVINGDWLDEMASQALRPEIGCVGAKLYYPDGRIQHAGLILGLGGIAGHAWHGLPRDTHGQGCRALLQQTLSAVTAACLLIRRETYLKVGGLDEENFKVALNDVDFCLKVRAAGYRNLFTPFAELYHHESASRGYEDTGEKHRRFSEEVERLQRKWGEALFNDPAYNPNLTFDRGDFSFASPPRVPAFGQ
jgi:GT2 family glycosyltransferase/glycosyltransferase involved in cell wall biosynthesis